MPREYDAETRTKSVRPVTDHVQDYDFGYEATKTVAARKGKNPQDAHERGAPSDGVDLEGCDRPSSCGRATRDRGDVRVHHRAQGPDRGRFDLPRALRAPHQDRPEDPLRVGGAGAVQAGLAQGLTHLYELNRPAASGLSAVPSVERQKGHRRAESKGAKGSYLVRQPAYGRHARRGSRCSRSIKRLITGRCAASRLPRGSNAPSGCRSRSP